MSTARPCWPLIAANDFPFSRNSQTIVRGADFLPNSANPYPRLAPEKGDPWESPDCPRFWGNNGKSADFAGYPFWALMADNVPHFREISGQQNRAARRSEYPPPPPPLTRRNISRD